MADSTPANQGRAWAIFAVCSLGFVLSQFYRVSATVISPQLSQDLSLSVDELATLSAAFFYAFAACQVAVALVLDRFGARRSMVVFALLGLAGAGLFALAQGLGSALGGRVLLGVGLSCNLMGPMLLMAAWFPPGRLATLSGLMVGIGYMGPLLAATPLAWLAQNWGWRWGFICVGALHALQTLGVLLVVRDAPPGGRLSAAPGAGRAQMKDLRQLLSLPAFWLIGMGSFFRYGCLAALMGLWAGPFLITGLGMDPITAGNVLLALSLTHIVGLPLSGRLSDKTLKSRKGIIIAGLVLTSGLTLALIQLTPQGSAWWAAGLFALIGLAASPGQIMYVHIKELAPPSVQGAAMTGVNLFTMLGPAMVMQAVGALVASDPKALAQAGAFTPAWLLMAGGLALAALLYLLVPDTKPVK